MDNDVLDDFAAYQRGKGLADTTVRNRESILRTMQRAAGRPLLEVELNDLRRYLGRPDVKAGSRRTERGAMIAFYTFLHDEGLRDDNPTVRLSPITAPKGEPRPFTREQIDAMLTSGAYRKTRAMILLGYYQGFRVSSIARVHGCDVDTTGGTIRTVGKGKKERTLPLHPVIAQLATTMPADDWWFPARNGESGHISPASVTNLITIAKHRAGILDPNLTPHSLRHAFGTDLVEEGVDIRVIQELMMHESLATTQIYTGVSSRRKQEGIQTLHPRPIPDHSGRRAA
jgi:integrase/recombinase XerD